LTYEEISEGVTVNSDGASLADSWKAMSVKMKRIHNTIGKFQLAHVDREVTRIKIPRGRLVKSENLEQVEESTTYVTSLVDQ
jgi:hypothetical protein